MKAMKRLSRSIQPLVGAVATSLLLGACGPDLEDATAPDEETTTVEAAVSSASPLVGWATVGGTVSGGGSAKAVTVTSLSALNAAAKGTTAAVIQVSGTISGDVSIGSNKTIVGTNSSATIKGHIDVKGSANVILRNLNVVGYNCSDNSNCESGADAIAVTKSAHHLFFDHLDISDGSDGNLDITHGCDFITIAWTKFHYSSSSRAHRFSNLIGHSDSNASEDTGHLNITIHHSWWATNVVERMPRVRFGKVHLFNNLFTATGNSYGLEAGNSANVMVENNVFVKLKNPIDLSHGDSKSVVTSRNNIFSGTSGTSAGKGTAFNPASSYKYTVDAAANVQAIVMSGAGPH